MDRNGHRGIGVYICHCGTNIAQTVDVKKVSEYAGTLDSVVVARDYMFMCSDVGQELIENDIRELGLNRVVVASCSPRMHELTFRKVCQRAGLNPYLFEMANIREQCSWVHSDKDLATEKAKALVRAAVKRAFYQEPLETKEAPVNPNTLVVGGGIAGIQAALEIADSEHKVYLVEREPSIGGHMIQLDKTFPTLDCSSCITTPKMSAAGSHPYIDLMTYSEVEEVSGYIGNFKVRIRRKARYVDEDKCNSCGVCQEKCPWQVDSEFNAGLIKRKAIYTPFPQAVPNIPVIDTEHCAYFLKGTCRACEKFCDAKAINFEQTDQIIEVEVGSIIVATGYDVFDPSVMPRYGYGRYDNVITSLEFERLSSATGPTGGRILLKDGREPESVAIIHCVGSRDQNYHEYCSRVCCMYALKFAHLIKEKTNAHVYQMYIDMRCFGAGYEEFYRRVSQEGVTFIRGKVSKVTDHATTEEEKGKLIVVGVDTVLGSLMRVPVDMVVLCAALEARSDADKVARMFAIGRRADGFFLERHVKLDPIATPTGGVLIAGCCQSPKDIPDTVAQASAAAARALALISKGKVDLEAAVACVDETRCQGCGRCEEICEFHAPRIRKNGLIPVSSINEVLCKGCGACAVSCPTGAISIKHFTRQEILAELEALAGV
ncbi:MAG: CoB--CoM heterodisulfide reductase iron-sulfur subunit A family protein [Dehalococcoidia bacterium]